MGYMCTECTNEQNVVEFDMKADWLAHVKAHKEGKPLPMPEKAIPDEPVKQEAQPIPAIEKPFVLPVLKYIYEGTCSACNKQIETIEINVGEAFVVLAYCSVCKKQFDQKEVIPIAKQLREKHTKS